MRKFFSLHSGQIYEVSEEEGALLDLSQVPLLHGPKHSCKKCYGRGWMYKEKIQNIYQICKCLPVDWKEYIKRQREFEAIQKPVTIQNAL